ncbi:MAG: cell division protein SepF [Abditibacteriaceae bacterium]
MDVKSFAKNALGNIWGQGGDEEEDFTAGTTDESTSSHHDRYGAQDTAYEDQGMRHGTSLLNGNRRLRPVNHQLRANEKNIYTLRPKNLEEAAVAADCIKSGSAVVINHEMVDRATSLRIVDFMSGVCYGLDQQGHAMKLGETIFLFTPGEYEISSDEVDYGENRDHFFKSEERASATSSVSSHQYASTTPTASTHQYASASPTASANQYASVSPSAPAPINPNHAPSPSYSRITIPNDQVASHIGKPHVERRSWER